MVNINGVAGLVFPAVSLRVILSIFDPSGSTEDGVTDQFPDPSTVPVPMTVPEALVIVTIDHISHVPVMVGVVSLLAYGAVVSHPTVVTLGATGARESTVKLRIVGALGDAPLAVEVARIVLAHCGNDGGTILYVPDPFTTPVTRRNQRLS